jgi:hypothetical protein
MWDKACGLLLVASVATGCALDQFGSLYASPGKYDTLKCPDLNSFSTNLSVREKELTSLIDRANQETGGPIVSALTYQTDLDSVRANLAMVKKAAADKNCDQEPSPR